MAQKRTKEGMARRLAQSRERKRVLRLDPEYRKKEADKALLRYYENRESLKARVLAWREENREALNDKRRRWRRANPELAKIHDKRHRETTITTAIRKFKRGELGLNELNRRLNEALVRVNDRTQPKGCG